MEFFWPQAQPVSWPAESGLGPPASVPSRSLPASPQRPTGFVLRSKVFSWLYCHIARKTAQIEMANRSMAPGIILSYAISADPGGGYSCDGWGSLLAVSDCCRLL